MQYTHIAVRFGELYTKGKNRQQFIQRLQSNVRRYVADFPAITIVMYHDHLLLNLHGTDYQIILARLQNVFGIAKLQLCRQYPRRDLAEIIADLLGSLQGASTFKLVCKRKDKSYPLMSTEIVHTVASALLKGIPTLKVDVHQPQRLIQIMVNPDAIYVVGENVSGKMGYPVGTHQGLAMLSGGIDSPVASYLALKRGVLVHLVHFASPPYTSEQAEEKVRNLVRCLTKFHPQLKLYILRISRLQELIHEHVDSSYEVVILRRYMYRLTAKLGERLGTSIIFNGECLGQVASQTIEAMQTVSAVTKQLILRPLLCFDKLEIIDIAQKIGTYPISILEYEDCCTIFNPKNPSTRPTIEKAEKYEQLLEEQFPIEQLLEEILAEVTVEKFTFLGKE